MDSNFRSLSQYFMFVDMLIRGFLAVVKNTYIMTRRYPCFNFLNFRFRGLILSTKSMKICIPRNPRKFVYHEIHENLYTTNNNDFTAYRWRFLVTIGVCTVEVTPTVILWRWYSHHYKYCHIIPIICYLSREHWNGIT